jgi:hypothetical protein
MGLGQKPPTFKISLISPSIKKIVIRLYDYFIWGEGAFCPVPVIYL